MQNVIYTPTVLIFTEGKHDCQLIKNIQRIYNTKFIIRQGNGSTPKIILQDCLKENGSFDIRYCVLDGDTIVNKVTFDKMVKTAKTMTKGEFELITVITNPCIEAVNLALFDNDISGFQKANCGVLKEKFKTLLAG